MGWIFETSGPMGGAAGEAYANTLKSPGMPNEHVLAREAIQNSVDAGLEGKKVEVRFRATVVKGAAKMAFAQTASLRDIAARAEQLELAGVTCLATLDDLSEPLSLLYVEDFNAVGLSGKAHDRESNFYRLLLSLGDRSKSRSARNTGGSYGFGKSVYSSSSAIQTIFAYTRFVDEDGGEQTRIFGCGYLISHQFEEKSYNGRAWLGSKPGRDEEGRQFVDPLEGAPADLMAAKLGFEPRAPGQLGTSILIVDAHASTEAIVRGVENWWWPRLVENKLDVVIEDADGAKHHPKPKSVDALKPFINAFDIVRTRSTPKQGSEKLAMFQRDTGFDVPTGGCGFVVVPVDEGGNSIVPAERINSVALIRGPLMVVAYHQVSHSSTPVVGAYLAPENDFVDKLLRKSEPPAHDRWDPDSTNLRDATGDSRKLVKAILSRINQGLRRFQAEAAPPAPVRQRRLALLERALGGYFKPHGKGAPVVPESGPSPLRLDFTDQPSAVATDDGMLRMRSTFVVRLDASSPDEEVNMRLTIHCPVLEDDSEEGDDLLMDVKVTGVEAVADEEEAATYRFTLAKGAKARFKIESEPYDPAWTVRLRPDMEREVA